MHVHIHMCVCLCTHPPPTYPTHIHTHRFTHIHIHIHAHTHTYTYACTHTYSHTYIYTHTYAHTHKLKSTKIPTPNEANCIYNSSQILKMALWLDWGDTLSMHDTLWWQPLEPDNTNIAPTSKLQALASICGRWRVEITTWEFQLSLQRGHVSWTCGLYCVPWTTADIPELPVYVCATPPPN